MFPFGNTGKKRVKMFVWLPLAEDSRALKGEGISSNLIIHQCMLITRLESLSTYLHSMQQTSEWYDYFLDTVFNWVFYSCIKKSKCSCNWLALIFSLLIITDASLL